MSPSAGQLKRDINRLRTEILILKSHLIPFTAEDMELLSINQSDKTVKKGMSKTTQGIFTTIYYEKFMAYITKKYSNGQYLILACTSAHEFIYLVNEDKTYTYYGDSAAGILTKDGMYFDVKNKLIACITGDTQSAKHLVTIHGKDCAYIANPRYLQRTLPRAFSTLMPMNKEEQKIFMNLIFIFMIEAEL
jgi:hypothetical protein